MAQGGKALGITGVIGLIILVVFIFVFTRSCHQGNNPQSLDDVPDDVLEEQESSLLMQPLPAAQPASPLMIA